MTLLTWLFIAPVMFGIFKFLMYIFTDDQRRAASYGFIAFISMFIISVPICKIFYRILYGKNGIWTNIIRDGTYLIHDLFYYLDHNKSELTLYILLILFVLPIYKFIFHSTLNMRELSILDNKTPKVEDEGAFPNREEHIYINVVNDRFKTDIKVYSHFGTPCIKLRDIVKINFIKNAMNGTINTYRKYYDEQNK